MQNYTHTLQNGFKIVFIPKIGTKICKISVLVDAGSMCEDAGGVPSGTAHFVEHMVFNGTKKYPNRNDLFNLVVKEGGTRGASTSQFIQNHFVSTLKQFVVPAFEYLSETLLNAVFTEQSFAKEKPIILSEFKKNDSNPDTKFYFHGVNATVFENKSLQNYMLGNRESIESITLKNITDFYNTYFTPNRMTLFIIGDFQKDEIITLSEKYFGEKIDTNNTTETNNTIIKIQEPHNTVLKYSGLTNSKIGCTQFIPNVTLKRYFSIMFLFRILCVGPTSRLFHELREKRGLIYQISPNNMFTPSGFMVGIVTQSEVKDIPEIKEVILNEIKDIENSGVLESELSQIKNRHFQTMERQNDATESLCSEYVEYYRKFKTIYDPIAETELVNSITVSDIKESAKLLLEKDFSWIEMLPE